MKIHRCGLLIPLTALWVVIFFVETEMIRI